MAAETKEMENETACGLTYERSLHVTSPVDRRTPPISPRGAPPPSAFRLSFPETLAVTVDTDPADAYGFIRPHLLPVGDGRASGGRPQAPTWTQRSLRALRA